MTNEELLRIIEKAAKDGVTYLSLLREGLTTLPGEIGQLGNLTTLYLDGNQLTTLPGEIGQLGNLTTLDLRGNKLTTLPGEIGQLGNLRKLDLRYNQLTTLPGEIGQLGNLTWLDLSYNQLTTLPGEIGQLGNLTELYLSGNQLTTLPGEIGQLGNLTILDLRGKLTTLPGEIVQLGNLTILGLSRKLTTLPGEIGQLGNLRKLDLRYNQLTTLPEEIVQLVNLKTLNLSDNPLTSPPPEILEQGTEAVLAYLREQLRAKQPQWVSKLIVVGEGGVGKTSLLRSLRNESFNTQESTTHGIEIRTLELAHPTTTGVTMQLNTWDFGGQEIYHATHQFFLTNRSLFLLAWNARHGFEQGRLYYWLDTIQSLAPDSPILLVATHMDERDANIPLSELRRKYPQIVGQCEISSKTTKGIDNLRQSITENAAKLPLMGEIWPTTWLDAANAIRNLPEKYITPQQLAEIIVAKSVFPDSVAILAQWLHELGDIIYFRDNEELNDIVILKPQWVTEYISKVLTSRKVINNSGIFTRTHQAQLWQDLAPFMRDHFLRLMERFDLSYRIRQEGANSATDISLIVELLPLDAPNYHQKWDAIRVTGNCNEMSMKWQLNTIPAGIPTWFIAREHRFSTGIHWSKGALFTDREQKHLALVQAFPQERYLQLTIRGANPQNFFALLKDGIELTLARFPGLQIKSMIPCPGNNNQPCSHDFHYQTLEKYYEKKRLAIECPECLEQVSVIKLLFGLDFTPPNIAISPVESFTNVLLSRIDQLETKMSQGDNNIQAKLTELGELTQREFLKSFRIEQAKIESHCPNIFVLRPRDSKNWQRTVFGQKLDLQLYCQAPGCWHPTQEGGLYSIDDPAQWLQTMAPYVRNLVKVLKFATPFVGPWVRVLNPNEFDDLFKNDMELMKQLGERLPEIEGSREFELSGGIGKGSSQNIDPEYLQGANLRGLHELLKEKDPQQHWGGLKKVLTPEGHYLWLCEYHAQQYKP